MSVHYYSHNSFIIENGKHEQQRETRDKETSRNEFDRCFYSMELRGKVLTFFSGFGRGAPQDKQADGDGEAHAGKHRDPLYVHHTY